MTISCFYNKKSFFRIGDEVTIIIHNKNHPKFGNSNIEKKIIINFKYNELFDLLLSNPNDIWTESMATYITGHIEFKNKYTYINILDKLIIVNYKNNKGKYIQIVRNYKEDDNLTIKKIFDLIK